MSILYTPSAEVRGGSGDLYLKITGGHPDRNNSGKVLWVIGKRENSEGAVTGEMLSTSSEENMMLDAVRQELTAAGYNVEQGPTIPAGVRKEVDLTSIRVEVNETDGIPKNDADGMVKISMDVRKNGVIVKKLGYEAKVSDFAIINRNLLPRKMIERGLQDVMSQAVPDIISALELTPAR
jgi:hypothetical protein